MDRYPTNMAEREKPINIPGSMIPQEPAEQLEDLLFHIEDTLGDQISTTGERYAVRRESVLNRLTNLVKEASVPDSADVQFIEDLEVALDIYSDNHLDITNRRRKILEELKGSEVGIHEQVRIAIDATTEGLTNHPFSQLDQKDQTKVERELNKRNINLGHNLEFPY